MNYSFHPEAEAEFFGAIDYYEECEIGLGYEFAAEVHYTIQNIIAYPEAWPILEGEVRRSQTRRFPYGVIYSEEDSGVFILSVMHLHRDPDYWKHRIE